MQQTIKFFIITILVMYFLSINVVLVHAVTKLDSCWDDQLGVRLLCHDGWEFQEEENALLLIIDEDPAVTLTIAKIDMDVHYLEQIPKTNLFEMQQYQEGFDVERTQLSGQDALKVKAYSRVYPQMRLCDYYVIYDNTLYGLLFFFYPKESWQEYKFLIQKIVNSFMFTEREKYPSISRNN